jgi:hypothetical protein
MRKIKLNNLFCFRFFFTHVNANGLKKNLAAKVMQRRLADVICDNFPKTKVTNVHFV